MKEFFTDFYIFYFSVVPRDSPDKSDQAGDGLLCPRDPRARDWSAVMRASSEYSWTPHLSHDMSLHHSDRGHLAQLSADRVLSASLPS